MSTTPSKWPGRLIITVGVLFVSFLVIHFAGIGMLRYFVERELHPAAPKGTYIGEVQLNLFSGRLEIEDFRLHQDDQLRMRLSRLLVDISPWRLLTGHIHVDQLAAANGYVRVDRTADGGVDLGLPPFGVESGPQHPAEQPPPFSLARALVEGLTIEYHDGDFASNAYIEVFEVGAYSASGSRQTVPVAAKLAWDSQQIEGHADLEISPDGVAVDGRVTTDPLDLVRLQQAARREPIATGRLAFSGDIAWRAPELTLRGDLQAPELGYAEQGRSADLAGLSLPGFGLLVNAAEPLVAELTLAKPLVMQSAAFKLNGQGEGSGADIQFATNAVYQGGVAFSLADLAATIGRLDWRDGQRELNLHGLELGGQTRQALSGQGGLPTFALHARIGDVAFSDTEQQLRATLNDLRLDKLALLADGEGAVMRRLKASLQLGGGSVDQADSSLAWQGLNAPLEGDLDGDTINLTSAPRIKALKVEHPLLAHGPVSVGEVSAQGLTVGDAAGFASLRLADINVPGGLDEATLLVDSLRLQDGGFSASSGVSLGEIVVSGLRTGVIRSADGVWHYPLAPPASQQSATNSAAPTSTTDASAAEPLAWRVGGLHVEGDSRITVADRLNPDMQPVSYQLERIRIGALDSTEPGRETPFEIDMRPDKYAEFKFAGSMRPLADKLFLNAEGFVHGFGLATFNGLIANDLGHRFLDGQLDNDFTIAIDHDKLDMANQLALSSVAVEELPGKEGPPLSTAIALLEDRDGNIKLEVPVSGNLADPDFRVMGALNPIIMKAVAGTAALAIQPLGSVLLVGGLLADQALKVTFEPALFEAGSTQLNDGTKQYLTQLAAKLKDKPKLGVRVCGVVAPSERKKDKNGKFVDDPDALLGTAKARADAVRQYLVGEGAGQRQARACRPRIDDKPDGQPRVDIRF